MQILFLNGQKSEPVIFLLGLVRFESRPSLETLIVENLTSEKVCLFVVITQQSWTIVYQVRMIVSLFNYKEQQSSNHSLFHREAHTSIKSVFDSL